MQFALPCGWIEALLTCSLLSMHVLITLGPPSIPILYVTVNSPNSFFPRFDLVAFSRDSIVC